MERGAADGGLAAGWDKSLRLGVDSLGIGRSPASLYLIMMLSSSRISGSRRPMKAAMTAHRFAGSGGLDAEFGHVPFSSGLQRQFECSPYTHFRAYPSRGSSVT